MGLHLNLKFYFCSGCQFLAGDRNLSGLKVGE